MARSPASGSAKVKVLRLAGRLNLGGPVRQLLPLCRDLAPARFESLLCFGEVDEREREALEPFLSAKIPLERVPRLHRRIRPLREAAAFWSLLRILRRERPGILHTHLAKAGVLGRLAGLLMGVPVRVHTFHGLNFRGQLGPAGSRLSLWTERLLARLPTCLIAVSESVREELRRARIGPASKVVVIEPGIALEPFLAVEGRSGALRGRFRVPDAAPLIGFVGRLAAVKDPEDFLAMAAAVGIAAPETRFVMVGDGELRGLLAEQVQALGLRDRVFFAGWREDMAECLADLDLVVCTSRSEGMPVALIEAMAAALPVVARAVGGVPELVEEGRTGLLVAPGSEEGLEQAVLGLLGNRTRMRMMGRAGRELVRDRFAAARLVADTERLYATLLEGGDLSQFGSAGSR